MRTSFDTSRAGPAVREPLRVLVCGGRDYSDYATLSAYLDRYAERHVVAEVIHGEARGADSMAARWAMEREIPTRSFPADWARHGKKAGPIRNRQMLDEGQPHVVIAFPGGRGTEDMKFQAANRDIPIVEVHPQGAP